MDHPKRRRRPGPLTDLPHDLPPDRAALALELRHGRDKAGLSLDELARRTYSSKASVSRWLSGQSRPDREQAARWAAVCGTDPVRMARLWVAAVPAGPGRPAPAGRTLPTPEPRLPAEATHGPIDQPHQPHRYQARNHRRAAAWSVLAVLTVGAVLAVIAWAGPSRPPAQAQTRPPRPCRAAHPVVLQIPPQTGTKAGITVEALCDLSPSRTYAVLEKVLDVSASTNPHPVYFIKAVVPHLKAHQVYSRALTLLEPVRTQSDFFVISADGGGWRALHQNQVVDHGILFLPRQTRRESAMMPHYKGWS